MFLGSAKNPILPARFPRLAVVCGFVGLQFCCFAAVQKECFGSIFLFMAADPQRGSSSARDKLCCLSAMLHLLGFNLVLLLLL